MNKKFEGKGGIYAQVIADSINPQGDRLTTLQLHYHRYIHSEFMTHRMFSRNASSSRAIPVKSMLEYIENNPAIPFHWGKNQAGMQADGENDTLIDTGEVKFDANGIAHPYVVTKKDAWERAMHEATFYANAFDQAGYHKQIVNRITEPYQFMNTVVSATDLDNFFFLRCHKDAAPEIHELADLMYDAREQSEPELLREGMWHTPYVEHHYDDDGVVFAYKSGHSFIDVEDAIKISASCAAQVSYRKNDTSLDKAISIFDKLVGMSPLHASPFEHVATPFTEEEYISRNRARVIMQKEGFIVPEVMYKGNFQGWTQFRKTLKGENITDYEQ